MMLSYVWDSCLHYWLNKSCAFDLLSVLLDSYFDLFNHWCKVILFLFYLNIKEIYSLKVNNQSIDNKITDRLVNLKRMQIFF